MQIFHENDFAKIISVNFTFYNLRSIKLIILSFRITYYKIRKIKKPKPEHVLQFRFLKLLIKCGILNHKDMAFPPPNSSTGPQGIY